MRLPETTAFGRARAVALQGALGAGLAGAALGGPEGWALLAAGAGTGVVTVLRRDGQWLDARLLARLCRGALAPGPGGPRDPGLGLAATLLPALETTETGDRNGGPVGVLSDGRGHAAVLALPPGVLPAPAADTLGEWLAHDPARPVTVQLLVEQFGLPSWDFHRRFEPTLAYRQLPAGAGPVAVRSHLVVRYEPWDAPEVAAARGGGAAGARAALAAATARLRARLAALDVPAEPLDGDGLRELLRDAGDPDGSGRALADSWAGPHTTHCVLAARLTGTDAWLRLLAELSATGLERTVAAVTFGRTATGTEARVAVRLVGGAAQRVAECRERLVGGGTALPLTGAQPAGLVATLPVAHPARPLEAATGFAPDRARHTARARRTASATPAASSAAHPPTTGAP
ncbi:MULTISPECIES: type VII secretion protein EccE [unclassified Streptomyces]|uniref:type VII secretion protein EccE n=1 Tax=unclassified Streptomyces TaxID=2593676 RepID=UPI0022B74FBF|nr:MULTISPECIES: type VII secretion protein EccE [unclassified Streptomyces]MCZ7413891.1 type VII secretion protein EccE [Streptomyces sp. WMMC897]MCZ7430887.1 type VII secretion protein EccE [Streptomyces sp. WMMC1477]